MYGCKLYTSTDLIFLQQTQEEWQIVFYICSAISILGVCVFLLFGSGELQDWARTEPTHIKYITETGEEVDQLFVSNILDTNHHENHKLAHVN